MPALTEDAYTRLLERTRHCSPFAARLLENPQLSGELRDRVHEAWGAEAMRTALAAADIADEAGLKQALRRLRQRVMLRVIARDLGGLANLSEVVETCTVLAEVTVGFALEQLSRWQVAQYGEPRGEDGSLQQLVVVGMGKLGGRELNVSSDIDLIFAYAQDGETSGARVITNHEYFARLGKKLIAAIGEITADGFVFRVDMRLRPYGDSGPLVGSYAALEEYYQTQGREWERYAWIKGRVIAGADAELETLLKPFVFRKYLDYGAIASMRDLKAQIEREVARREMHDNIKLGPGGIREVEFIAQVFQLIRGGKDRELQLRPTLQVLARLVRKGLLPQVAVDELCAAYIFLRNLEHRLQYLQDAQTQMLPHDEENRARLAAGMNFPDWTSLAEALEQHRGKVERYFEDVFEESAPEAGALSTLWQGQGTQEEAAAQLVQLGYRDAEETLQRLGQLREGSRYRQLPQASRERFDVLMPQLVQSAAGLPNPDVALTRTITLFEAICRRANYLALLAEYPQALELVSRLCGASPWLATYLTQHPILLDELLDTRSLFAAPDFALLAEELEQALADCGDDIEAKLDALRHFKHAHTFRFAAQDLTGRLQLEKLSDYLSALADVVLDAVIRHAWLSVPNRHRPAPAFAIIGYGKLGGKELGYASDLDLVFLYDDEAEGDASAIYGRLGQRINNWLNSLTPAGQLYETDLRLRPDGASGLMVSSLAAFDAYQRGKAWTWEHQALTRARFCAGDAAIGAAFERIRHEVLCQPRDHARLHAEVLEMRQKMIDGHPNDTALFDLKHDRGGIVDVEFIVQTLVLEYAGRHVALTANSGNIALLGRMGELGLIPVDLAAAAASAYREYRREQHALRLQGLAKARVEPAAFAGPRAAVAKLWGAVFGEAIAVD